MPSVRVEDLTPFGRLALQLDRDFAELARAGEQMAKVNLETDNGVDEGVKILNRVAKYGESIAANMQEFAQALQQARDKAEAAAALASERAQLIQQRRQKQQELQDKLTKAKEDVAAFGAGLSAPRPETKGPLSDEDKKKIAADLERLQAPIAGFIEAIQALKAEAAGLNFKRLERQADSMIDSLQATRRKIAQALDLK